MNGRVLITRDGGFGDIIMLEPFYKAVKAKHPDKELAFGITNQEYLSLKNFLPSVDYFVMIDDFMSMNVIAEIGRNGKPINQLDKPISAKEYADVVYDLYNLIEY